MVVRRFLEQRNREKHFYSHERPLEKPASGTATHKSKRKTVEIAYGGQQKVNALEDTSVD